MREPLSRLPSTPTQLLILNVTHGLRFDPLECVGHLIALGEQGAGVSNVQKREFLRDTTTLKTLQRRSQLLPGHGSVREGFGEITDGIGESSVLRAVHRPTERVLEPEQVGAMVHRRFVA
jgi:hypothetical protein